MIEAPHYTAAGAKRDGEFALPADYFDGTVNEPVLHQAVKAYLNNQRQGTAHDQDPELRLRRQPEALEAEGHRPGAAGLHPRARTGGAAASSSVRTPRDYRTDIPRKVRQLARQSRRSTRGPGKARCTWSSGSPSAAPKTAQLAGLLGRLGLDGPEGAGADGRAERQRVPERAQPARPSR